MKRLVIIASFFLMGLACSLHSQEEVTPREPKWKQVSQAYGFVVAQKYSLERVVAAYPDLTASVRDANFAFMSTALGDGANALETELQQQLGDEWPEMKLQMEEQAHQITDKQGMSRESAMNAIEEVKRRAKGVMPDSMRNTLLAMSPAYVKSPGTELTAGWRQNFSTLKHPKSEVANITIGMPLSWRKRESTRDGIVQVFRSGAGHGPILCNIICNKVFEDSDGDATHEDMKEFFTKDALTEMIGDAGTIVESKPMMIAGAPGGMAVFDIEQEMLDMKSKMRSATFMIIHKKHLIQVNFLILGPILKDMNFDEAQKAFFPTYRAIMATLVRNWNGYMKTLISSYDKQQLIPVFNRQEHDQIFHDLVPGYKTAGFPALERFFHKNGYRAIKSDYEFRYEVYPEATPVGCGSWRKVDVPVGRL